MGANLVGADLEALAALEQEIERQASALVTLMNAASSGVNTLDRLWDGPDSAQFKRQWLQLHRPKLNRAAQELRDAAASISRNRQAQEVTSTADGATGPGAGFVPPGAFAAGTPFAAGAPFAAGPPFADDVVDFLFGDVANFWSGGDEGLPVGQMAAALLKMNRMYRGELPLFNTGAVGVRLASLLQQGPGVIGQSGLWLQSPAATTFFRRAGIAGGVISTGVGLYGLYQQGNPIDAFQENGAGYVSDVASTAFSASTTAFLLTGNPAFAAVAIGSGAVWLGAEVVENWDDITEWTSDAWDTGADFLGDVWDGGADLASDVWGAGSDLADDFGGAVDDLASGAWDVGSGLVGAITSPSDWF